MSDVILLFSGQGAQRVGMGKDLAEASAKVGEMFSRGDEVLGFGLSEVMFSGPDEELTRTSRCQPALYLHGLACLELLRERCPGLNVVAAAGLSLGEFTAHTAAGSFSFETGIKLVARRGLFMEEACEATEGTMVALIGGEADAIAKLAEDCDVDISNRNAPGQTVLSGSVEGIEKVIAGAKEAGIRRAIPLPVAGAYHSRLMSSAQEKLAAELATAEISSPGIPVICNVEGRQVTDPADIRSTLEHQVTGVVRWADSLRKLLELAPGATFVELGPDRALSGMLAKIDSEATSHAIGDLDSLAAAVSALS